MAKPKKPFESKQPVTVNDEFFCRNCGKHSPKADKTCRNHCRSCLCSLHVDEKVPGDRKSLCQGLMLPAYIDHSGKKGLQIVHVCTACGKKSVNRAADDDNPEAIAAVMRIQNRAQTGHLRKK